MKRKIILRFDGIFLPLHKVYLRYNKNNNRNSVFIRDF